MRSDDIFFHGQFATENSINSIQSDSVQIYLLSALNDDLSLLDHDWKSANHKQDYCIYFIEILVEKNPFWEITQRHEGTDEGLGDDIWSLYWHRTSDGHCLYSWSCRRNPQGIVGPWGSQKSVEI